MSGAERNPGDVTSPRSRDNAPGGQLKENARARPAPLPIRAQELERLANHLESHLAAKSDPATRKVILYIRIQISIIKADTPGVGVV